MKRRNLIIIAIIFLLLLSFGVFYIFVINQNQDQSKNIKSFDDCAKVYPVLESFPERCNTPDGKTFVKATKGNQDIDLIGEVVCLPHKDKEGPQTLECAIGLKSNNLYYGLSDPNSFFFSELQGGNQVNIKGKFTPSTDQNEKYDIVGTIVVDDVR